MRCLVALFLAASSTFLCAQMSERAPDTLLDAGHCLAADHRDWLDVMRAQPFEVDLGYVPADKSDSGKSPLYVIEFTTPTHTAGYAFAFLSHGKDSHRDLLLQFRTRFRQADDGSQQVSLVDPPLGGVGTQDEIIAAIHQVGFHTWSIPVADLKNHTGSVRCETAEATM